MGMTKEEANKYWDNIKANWVNRGLKTPYVCLAWFQQGPKGCYCAHHGKQQLSHQESDWKGFVQFCKDKPVYCAHTFEKCRHARAASGLKACPFVHREQAHLCTIVPDSRLEVDLSYGNRTETLTFHEGVPLTIQDTIWLSEWF